LGAGMLCLADRSFFGFDLWQQARATGADLLWRVKRNLRLPLEKRRPDGSYPILRPFLEAKDGASVRARRFFDEGPFCP
jgi:hypothetical protein